MDASDIPSGFTLHASRRSLLHRRLRHWLGILRSRLADSRPPFLSRSDDGPSTSGTELAFLRGSSLRLTFPHRRPSLPLRSRDPPACSNTQCAFRWSRATRFNFWPPRPPVPKLGLNRPDGRFDLGLLSFIADQRHRQQIPIRACVFCHACCLLVEVI